MMFSNELEALRSCEWFFMNVPPNTLPHNEPLKLAVFPSHHPRLKRWFSRNPAKSTMYHAVTDMSILPHLQALTRDDRTFLSNTNVMTSSNLQYLKRLLSVRTEWSKK